MMEKQVDCYKFLSGATKRIVKSWIKRAPSPQGFPWTPLSKPLEACTVALISSAGVALKKDRPFDQEGERQNPWWGDPSYRVIPQNATQQDVNIYHLHINPDFAQEDLNCIFPLQRLLALVQDGQIGRSAPRHYSIMGYILRPERLLRDTAPAIVGHLKEDHVDVVVLAPV